MRQHGAVLQAWACLALVVFELRTRTGPTDRRTDGRAQPSRWPITTAA